MIFDFILTGNRPSLFNCFLELGIEHWELGSWSWKIQIPN